LSCRMQFNGCSAGQASGWGWLGRPMAIGTVSWCDYNQPLPRPESWCPSLDVLDRLDVSGWRSDEEVAAGMADRVRTGW
jgi:hypothetical protein